MDDAEFMRRCLETVRVRAEEEFITAFQRLAANSESPIEARMAAALVIDLEMSLVPLFPEIFFEPGTGLGGSPFFGKETLRIWCQKAYADVRPDFLLEFIHPHSGRDDTHYLFAIECDGHDFHEKTKEQARRDKSRDRHLLKSGVHVVHFTGSEIWHDAGGCVSEVGAIMTRVILPPDPASEAEISRT